MDKFHNKYRIQSSRLQGWDYSQNGAYFITICSHNREHLFGYIEAETMVLSAFGQIVKREWGKSFGIRLELFCDVFVIMPNHLQAIVRIENDNLGFVGVVDTHGRAYLQPQQNQRTGVAYRRPKSISSFVAGFKSSVTKQINELRQTPKLPVWQARFHDHIIRNDHEYQHIYNYIKNNQANWKNDTFF
jgi:REP element-mobilizing transposase RayT